ncbi:fungal hydrophobin [Daedaleopsis nitida]|nr:fungal hydrophobin [Daedaleopsis nitida]
MMFSRLATITSIVSLAVLAAAIPTGGPPASAVCGTGHAQCCNSFEQAGYWYEHGGAGLAGLLGIVLNDMDAFLGLGCSPFLLNGGSGCHANTVCCEDNSHGGLIAIGCVPYSY